MRVSTIAWAAALLLMVVAWSAQPARAGPGCGAQYSTQALCQADCSCGWCTDQNQCYEGNAQGPTDGTPCGTGAWMAPDPVSCDACKSRSAGGCVQDAARCSACGYCSNSGECLTGSDAGPNAGTCTGTWYDPNGCPSGSTSDCTRWNGDEGSCLADCRCGFCSNTNQCSLGSSAGPYNNACPTPGAWHWSNQTYCDPCTRFASQSDCYASGTLTSGVVSNCGWCQSAQKCLTGAQNGPANPPTAGPGCGPWTAPYTGSNAGATGQCGVLNTMYDCTQNCGCGWCSGGTQAGTCVPVNAATGWPMSEGLCPAAFDQSQMFVKAVATCFPQLNIRDPCKDIAPEQCTQICGCGLCQSTATADITQSVCMSGSTAQAYGTCPTLDFQWIPPREGRTVCGNGHYNGGDPNALSNDNTIRSDCGDYSTFCIQPTVVPDPCSAYPADSYGSCESHCGCGLCTVTTAGTLYTNMICVTSKPDGTGPAYWGDPRSAPLCTAFTAPPGYSAANVGLDGQSTSGAPCRGHSVNQCWRQPQGLCGARDGVLLFDDRNMKSNPLAGTLNWSPDNMLYRQGCLWARDTDFQGCVPGQPGLASGVPAQAPLAVGGDFLLAYRVGADNYHNGNTFVGRSSDNAGRVLYSDAIPLCSNYNSDKTACAAQCGCGWCDAAYPNHPTVKPTCVRVDPWTRRASSWGACSAPRVLTTTWQAACTPQAQLDALNGGDNGQDRAREQIGVDEKSNLSLVAGCGAVLIATAIWFHFWHRGEESEPTGHPIRLPFPDKSDEQLEQRTCRKFLRLVQLYHPVAMLLYAAQRDGFGRWRRFFCVFVAMSCQLTVTLACLLGLTKEISNAYPGIVSSFISATVSFLYEKPIVKLVKFTARQECCGSCANCCLASMSYCAIVSCLGQIPVILIAFWFLFIRTSQIVVYFGFTQLLSAWAASVALGYLTQIPSLAVRFCLCPAKYTREINEYNREYEQFGKAELAKLQAAAKAKHAFELAALGGDTNAVVAIAASPKAGAGKAGGTTGTVAAVTGGIVLSPAPASTTLAPQATMADTAAAAAAMAANEVALSAAAGGAGGQQPFKYMAYGTGGGTAHSSSDSPPVATATVPTGDAGAAATVADGTASISALVSLDAGLPAPGTAPEPQLPAAADAQHSLGGRAMSTRRNAFM